MNGRRRYGPHEPTPRTVTVLGVGKWPQEEQRPLPRGLEIQRRKLNDRAYVEGAR